MKKAYLLLVLFLLNACSGVEMSKNKEKIKAPFDGKRFNNIEPFEDKGFTKILKWQFSRKSANWEENIEQDFFKPDSVRSQEPKFVFIGHSTILIQVNNLNILTDPHYSQRSSPVSWAGPKRVIQPAIKFEDLPPIDLVLISHNHYDHLDLPTLKMLNKKFSPTFLVGLGNRSLLNSEGIQKVYEMDWWDQYDFQGIPIHFTPVQHWSARSLFDKRKTLWGGFYIQADKKIFFAGDTGYGKVFKMINEKYGKLDIGLIPIGAYQPRWFMRNAHVNPDDAIKIFQDLELQKAYGIHFGTFKDLTDEARRQPIIDLEVALKKYKLKTDNFIAPEFGPTYH